MGSFFYLSLTFNFAIWTTGIFAEDVVREHPMDEVILPMITQNHEELIVDLKSVDSFLANENLPVWIAQGNGTRKLIPDVEMMRTIGQFSMYQDSVRSSAAVYFYNLHEFYGVVDVRYIIKAVSITNINNPFEPKMFVTRGVQVRTPHQGHRKTRSSYDEDSSSLHLSTKPIGEQISNKIQSSVKVHRDLPQVVYVKALIIVNYDLLAAINSKTYNKFRIEHYILTLFNNVDMLFSKVKEPKIKINIAGIIIGTSRESFPSLIDCYKRKRVKGTVSHYMEVYCINSAITPYLQKHSKTISPDSYNIAIFLTRYHLNLQLVFETVPVHGINLDPTAGPYRTRRDGSITVPIISVHDDDNFGSYHTIAHEMAHALRVHAHDEKPYVDEEGKCRAYLMKEGSDTCENCLSWSPVTQERLKAFFRSKSRCFFINTPQSLEKPEPYKIWTADEQCQCYGYDSACAPKRSLIERLRKKLIVNECDRNLRCLDRNLHHHKAPFPLDGTPCGGDTNKVCWNRECRAVEAHDELGR